MLRQICHGKIKSAYRKTIIIQLGGPWRGARGQLPLCPLGNPALTVQHGEWITAMIKWLKHPSSLNRYPTVKRIIKYTECGWIVLPCSFLPHRLLSEIAMRFLMIKLFI